MSTPKQPLPLKYADDLDGIDAAVDIALAACRRLLTVEDLDNGWLREDLSTAWELHHDHLPEYALAGIGRQNGDDPVQPLGPSVDCFLASAAFFFYADALRQAENSKRTEPIGFQELFELVDKNLNESLRPKPPRKLILD